ncbi:MAG TPA: phycobilisome rod-core linker polypeptide [Coleofasciculaceae cyanobacterium]
MHHHEPVTVGRFSSLEERQCALTQIYYQALERQPYSFERRILAKIEKDFLKNKIGVRRFLKEFGKSEVYLNAFYHKFSNMKFLELCFKHFLGRSLLDAAEMHAYCNILAKRGVFQVITAILDSEEYCNVFGCFTVPYARQQNRYQSPKAFLETHLLNQEQSGQRSWSVPTMYWRQLGLVCEAGVCRHPEADEVLEPLVSKEDELSIEELLTLIEASTVTPVK